MNQEIAITALHSLGSLLGFGFLFAWLVRDYRLDALRQRLFNIRAELFDFADSGAIDFDHPAYGMLRSRLNRLIRFAHRFTSVELLLILLLPSEYLKIDDEPQQEWLTALDTVPSVEVRNQLSEYNKQMLVAIVKHLMYSPIIGVCSPLIVLVAFSRGMISISFTRKELADGALPVAT